MKRLLKMPAAAQLSTSVGPKCGEVAMHNRLVPPLAKEKHEEAGSASFEAEDVDPKMHKN